MALVVPSQWPGFDQCLFKLIGANFNITTDQPFIPQGGVPHLDYEITNIRAFINPASVTTNLTTAAGGIFPAASKSGTAIVGTGQAYSSLDTLAKGLDLTITAGGLGRQSVVPILSLTTAQGAAALVDLFIYGRIKTGI